MILILNPLLSKTFLQSSSLSFTFLGLFPTSIISFVNKMYFGTLSCIFCTFIYWQGKYVSIENWILHIKLYSNIKIHSFSTHTLQSCTCSNIDIFNLLHLYIPLVLFINIYFKIISLPSLLYTQGRVEDIFLEGCVSPKIRLEMKS